MTASLQYLHVAFTWDMHQQAFHAYHHSYKHCRARVHKMRVRLDQIHPVLDKDNLIMATSPNITQNPKNGKISHKASSIDGEAAHGIITFDRSRRNHVLE